MINKSTHVLTLWVFGVYASSLLGPSSSAKMFSESSNPQVWTTLSSPPTNHSWDSLACTGMTPIFGILVRSMNLHKHATFFSGLEFHYLPQNYIFENVTENSIQVCKVFVDDSVFKKFVPEKSRVIFTLIATEQVTEAATVDNCDMLALLREMIHGLKKEVLEAGVSQLIIGLYDRQISNSLIFGIESPGQVAAVEDQSRVLPIWLRPLIVEHFRHESQTHIYLMLLRDDPRIQREVHIDPAMTNLIPVTGDHYNYPLAGEPCIFDARDIDPRISIADSASAWRSTVIYVTLSLLAVSLVLTYGGFLCYRFRCFGLVPYLLIGPRWMMKFHQVSSTTSDSQNSDLQRVIRDCEAEISDEF